MLSPALLPLALVLGLAAAAPTARQAPLYPPTSESNAFLLVANVTDLSTAFGASINGWGVSSYHTGAGLASAVLAPSPTNGRIFYENGTAQQQEFAETSVLTDGGTPPAPYGWVVQNETQFDYVNPTEHDVFINVGAGTPVGLHRFPDPIPDLYGPSSGTYVACNNTVPYSGAYAVTIQYAYATFTNSTGGFDYEKNIPEGCVAIALLPQCTTINTLPAGSLSSHEYALEVNCYQNVSSIDWTVYSAY